MSGIAGRLLQPVVAPLTRMLAPWLLISTKRAVDQLMLAATGPPLQVAYHHEHSNSSTARAFMQDCIARKVGRFGNVCCCKRPACKGGTMRIDGAYMYRLQENILRMGSQGDPHMRLETPLWQRNCGPSAVSLQDCRKAIGISTNEKSSYARDEADSFIMHCYH